MTKIKMKNSLLTFITEGSGQKTKQTGMFLLILISFFLVFTGCKSHENNNYETRVYPASEEYVKTLGRTYYGDDDILWCAYSGTGIEFSFSGTKAQITLVGDEISQTEDNYDKYTRVAIYLNGNRIIDDMLDQKEKVYTVFDSETVQDAVISVVKLSESKVSVFGIKNIEVTSKSDISPTPQKDMFIEFIGDSITCAYGVDDDNLNHHFSTSTEDITKSYAYKTALALDADYSMVSISGAGVLSGYTSDETINTELTIPPYYDKLGFSQGSFNGTPVSSIEWDFNKHQPDIIIINLGTNDYTYCYHDADKQSDFTARYVEFLKQIKNFYPNSKIICSLGMMEDTLYPSIESAVNHYTAETGDVNIFCMPFEVQSAEDGYAVDWHPSEKTHSKAAEKLIDIINSIK